MPTIELNEQAIIAELQRMVTKYQLTKEGEWLQTMNWKSIPVQFKNFTNGICGAYSCGKIYLLTAYEASSIFSTYVHELRHRYQWKSNPIKYLIGKLYRPLIENDAIKHQEYADNWSELS